MFQTGLADYIKSNTSVASRAKSAIPATLVSLRRLVTPLLPAYLFASVECATAIGSWIRLTFLAVAFATLDTLFETVDLGDFAIIITCQ